MELSWSLDLDHKFVYLVRVYFSFFLFILFKINFFCFIVHHFIVFFAFSFITFLDLPFIVLSHLKKKSRRIGELTRVRFTFLLINLFFQINPFTLSLLGKEAYFFFMFAFWFVIMILWMSCGLGKYDLNYYFNFFSFALYYIEIYIHSVFLINIFLLRIFFLVQSIWYAYFFNYFIR